MAQETETVTLKLPNGTSQPFKVPKGLGDKGIRALIQKKHPELLQKGTPESQTPSGPSSPPVAGGGGGTGDEGQKGVSGAGPMARFGQGFGAGINPLHSVPPGTPSKDGPMGKAGDFAADMGNLREADDKFNKGDKAGAAGLVTGTVAGAVATEGIGKMIGSGMRALKGAASIASTARAGERAMELSKELGGGVQAARKAAEFTQPIMEAVSKQFDRLHTMLDKQTLNHSPQVVQKANLMKGAAEPMIKKLGTEIGNMTKTLAGGAQTVMEYGKAHELHKQIQTILSRMNNPVMFAKLGHWAADLKQLDEMLETGKAAVATANGVGKEWERLGSLWSQGNDLAKAIATRMEPEAKGIVAKGLEKVGIGGKTLPKGAAAAGDKLAKEAGVKGGLSKPLGAGAKAGKAAAHAATGGVPLMRGMQGLMGGDGAVPAGTQ